MGNIVVNPGILTLHLGRRFENSSFAVFPCSDLFHIIMASKSINIRISYNIHKTYNTYIIIYKCHT